MNSICQPPRESWHQVEYRKKLNQRQNAPVRSKTKGLLRHAGNDGNSNCWHRSCNTTDVVAASPLRTLAAQRGGLIMKGSWLTRLSVSMGIMVALLCTLGCGANNALPHPVPKVPAVGTLTFVNSSNPPTVVNPSTVQVADFKGNGKLDLAVASFGVIGGSVLLGNGDATF